MNTINTTATHNGGHSLRAEQLLAFQERSICMDLVLSFSDRQQVRQRDYS
jgi:hypothetical protein